MHRFWEHSERRLTTVGEVLDALYELQGRGWLSRGVRSKTYELVPTIDREGLALLSPRRKLDLERQSIDRFRASARIFASEGERLALQYDFIALAVLRHHDVPTRLLDWTLSPFVAALFAVSEGTPKEAESDGAIWSFDMRPYERNGRDQWTKWPQTTSDGTGNPNLFRAELSAFSLDEQVDWIICMFYPAGFPRQNAQLGAYTATARFGRNHGDCLAALLNGPEHCKRFIIPSSLKELVRLELRERHGLSMSAMYPDSAGAAHRAGADLSFTAKGG